MDAKKLKPIKSLDVHEGIQEVTAHEQVRLRYLVFVAVTCLFVIAAYAVHRSSLMDMHRYLLWGFEILLFPYAVFLTRPWHRVIVIDRNDPSVRVEKRLLLVLPFSVRRSPLDGSTLTVDHVSVSTTTEKAEEGAGSCLAFILPFPFGLLAAALSGDGKTRKVTVTVEGPGLLLEPPPPEPQEILAIVQDEASLHELLRATRHILPRHVRAS